MSSTLHYTLIYVKKYEVRQNFHDFVLQCAVM